MNTTQIHELPGLYSTKTHFLSPIHYPSPIPIGLIKKPTSGPKGPNSKPAGLHRPSHLAPTHQASRPFPSRAPGLWPAYLLRPFTLPSPALHARPRPPTSSHAETPLTHHLCYTPLLACANPNTFPRRAQQLHQPLPTYTKPCTDPPSHTISATRPCQPMPVLSPSLGAPSNFTSPHLHAPSHAHTPLSHHLYYTPLPACASPNTFPRRTQQLHQPCMPALTHLHCIAHLGNQPPNTSLQPTFTPMLAPCLYQLHCRIDLQPTLGNQPSSKPHYKPSPIKTKPQHH